MSWRWVTSVMLLLVVSLESIAVDVGATVVQTDRGVFALTSTGVAKIAAAEGKVARAGYWLSLMGRWTGPLAVGFAVIDVGLSFWDWWSRNYTVGGSIPVSVGAGNWGIKGTWGDFVVGVVVDSTGAWVQGPFWPTNTSTQIWVGGEWQAVTCTGAVPCHQFVMHSVQGVAVPVAASSTSLAGADNRGSVIAVLDQALSDLRGVTNGPVKNVQMTDSVRAAIISDLQAARDVLSAGVLVASPGDYSQGSNYSVGGIDVSGPAPQPVPSGGTANDSASAGAPTVAPTSTVSPQLTETNQALNDIDKKLDAQPSVAAPYVCPSCNRVDRWSEFWTTLRTAGQAAPVFGLINRLVVNPTGTVTKTATMQTSRWGALTVDLTVWGVDTWIGVLRYVVLTTSILAAYFVIFG